MSVGLRVISMLERKVDLDSVIVDQPRLRIVIYPDGSNNLPSPPGPGSGKSWAENFVNLKVHRYAVTNGMADIDIRQVPLSFNGEDLRVQMTRDVDRRTLSRQRGVAAAARLHRTSWPPRKPTSSAAFALDATRLTLSSVQYRSLEARASISRES